ncbi:MAG: bifunctional 23S rRNA (guanine(2069)-N(7))-methyltransferase RlmK/23S rRNA (guanine(2445)-N(2))-methyltransferase RlmL [Steroidobacteraceae bacterium]
MPDSTPVKAQSFFATCPLGVVDLLAAELKACGATRAREMKAGVEFDGTLETAYRACLWSRVASRILMPIAQVAAHDANAMYAGLQRIDWSQHLSVTGTLVVDFQGSSLGIKHTQFGALKTKDAIVDQFRDKFGERPSVNMEAPDVRINMHAHREQATVSIDLSGDSLHRRGYRARGVAAPLKENLAAAILLRAGWPVMSASGATLLDPMCGSGTLVIEAALMACDIAPGWLRAQSSAQWGMTRWGGHDATLWQRLLDEVAARAAAGRQGRVMLRGYDQDAFAIRAALENAERAGLNGLVHFEKRALSDLQSPLPQPEEGIEGKLESVQEKATLGLLVCNPPYGERIGDQDTLKDLYGQLGDKLRDEFTGWKAAVFTGNPPLAKQLGINAKRSHTLYNGALECRLLRFDIEPTHFNTPDSRPSAEEKFADLRQTPGAEMFANRLRKNFKNAKSWASKNSIRCYRLYDADMPEYSFAIDLYGAAEDATLNWAYVQEYAAPDSINRDAARMRRMQVLSVLPEVLVLPREQIFVRTRRQQSDHSQYEKLDEQREFQVVAEGGYSFYVNFSDYLDTGLFLDHRITRERLGQLCKGKRFLNLFAYTGAATVHAVGGGAVASTTVDMSYTYLEWAEKNLQLNQFDAPEHELIQGDCLQWLEHEAEQKQRQYDVIFIDPPTFSRSKRMERDFEVQHDHVQLILWAAELLAPGGVIVFSNNYTRFKLDQYGLKDFQIQDWSRETLPKDFERNPKIHCCFAINRP